MIRGQGQPGEKGLPRPMPNKSTTSVVHPYRPVNEKPLSQPKNYRLLQEEAWSNGSESEDQTRLCFFRLLTILWTD